MFRIVSFCPFKVQGTKGQTSAHTFVGFFVYEMMSRLIYLLIANLIKLNYYLSLLNYY